MDNPPTCPPGRGALCIAIRGVSIVLLYRSHLLQLMDIAMEFMKSSSEVTLLACFNCHDLVSALIRLSLFLYIMSSQRHVLNRKSFSNLPSLS